MMRIEQLSVANLREGVYCPHGLKRSEEVYEQLEAWLAGGILRGLVARADDGEPIGFILYYAIERVPMEVDGSGLYMVQCIFVRPEFQDEGVGRALVESALADASARSASGLAAQAHHVPPQDREDYLPGTFFQHLGMLTGESRGTATLYYVGLGKEVNPPRYLDPSYQPPPGPARLRIDVLDCRRCYTAVTNREIVKAVAEELGAGHVDVIVHDQNNRAAVVDKGMSSGVFIDGKLTFMDGPITEEDVWQAIQVADAARRLGVDR